ncbi:hypothetical protein EJB05_22182, partial [Eragrostis curvula]
FAYSDFPLCDASVVHVPSSDTETCALSKIFYAQHLRDYWCPKFFRICIFYDQHLRD